MNKKLNKYTYKITSDASFMDEQNAMTYELKEQLESLYHLALSGRKSGVKKFHRLIKKHPRNPQLKNYLSILYQKMGDTPKANEVTKWIVAEHPNYLFGKLNVAFKYLADEKYEKVTEVLGEELEIKALYPHRDTFHVSEITGFYKATVLYFIGLNNLKEAKKRVKLIKELAPDSLDAQEAENFLFSEKIKKASQKMRKEDEKRIKVEIKPTNQRKSTNKPPVFTHPEIQLVYTKDIKDLQDDLDTLLALPKETLIKDLELVLTNTIERKAYYYNKFSNEDDATNTFIIHAILLLGELKAKDSLPVIFELLQQDEEFLEFFIGDFITEYVWQTLFYMIQDRLDICQEFMQLPGVYTFSKSEIASAVDQIAWHFPQRKDEVIKWYKTLFEFYVQTDIDENIIDSSLIGILIGSAVELKAKELLPLIKELYKQHKVDVFGCGTYTSVAIDIQSKEEHKHFRKLQSIKEIYHTIITTWSSYIGEEGNHDDDDTFYEDWKEEPIIKKRKVGRNEPCPCGSGKKYKKCCLKHEKE